MHKLATILQVPQGPCKCSILLLLPNFPLCSKPFAQKCRSCSHRLCILSHSELNVIPQIQSDALPDYSKRSLLFLIPLQNQED
ncbi:hypothetical protein BpHYR1_010269 [Brachionus plicatilis]|uniref:Uncharacterized protein n=1 Tax=Brachionus plicatilis TaxID=10195 RepID=A0A3M7SML2_BRAPC|nr:hypothetical protein BpHYR1_010269 [Brachionus plicatilis]